MFCVENIFQKIPNLIFIQHLQARKVVPLQQFSERLFYRLFVNKLFHKRVLKKAVDEV